MQDSMASVLNTMQSPAYLCTSLMNLRLSQTGPNFMSQCCVRACWIGTTCCWFRARQDASECPAEHVQASVDVAMCRAHRCKMSFDHHQGLGLSGMGITRNTLPMHHAAALWCRTLWTALHSASTTLSPSASILHWTLSSCSTSGDESPPLPSASSSPAARACPRPRMAPSETSCSMPETSCDTAEERLEAPLAHDCEFEFG